MEKSDSHKIVRLTRWFKSGIPPIFATPPDSEGSSGVDVFKESAPQPSGGRKRSPMLVLTVIIVVAVVVIGAGLYFLVYHPASSTGPGGQPGHVSITVWQDFSPTEFPAFQSVLTSFKAANPNITVSWVNQTSPSPSGLVTAAAAGTAPNVIIGTSDFEGSTLYYHNLILNLSSYLNSSFLSQYSSTALGDVTYYNGSVYGLPVNVNGVAMIYNKQLVPNAPTTTNQMIAMGQNITVITGGHYVTSGVVYGLGVDGGYSFAAFQAGFGGRLFSANGAPTVNTTATVNAITFLNNLTYQYHIQPPGLTRATDISLFETGHAGITFDGPWDIQEYIGALGSANVGVAPIPRISQTGLMPLPFLGSIAGAVLTQKSSHASVAQINASVSFIKYLASTQSELKFWNSSGDFPSITSAMNFVEGLHVGWANGFLEQFQNYSQKFINIPQLGFYWTPFGTYISSYLANSTSAIAASQGIQDSISQNMTLNGITPFYQLQYSVSSQAGVLASRTATAQTMLVATPATSEVKF